MSVKSRDSKNRWRSKTVAFRVSPEEWAQINMMAYTSGLQKQDYLIKRVLQQDIIVQPSIRVQKALRLHLERIADELKQAERLTADDDLISDLHYLVSLIERLSHE